MLVGEGANLFALKQGIRRLNSYKLVTEERITELEKFQNQGDKRLAKYIYS